MKTNEKLNPRWMKWLKKKKRIEILYCIVNIICINNIVQVLLLEKFLP